MEKLTIGQLAEASGVHLETIRYYERIGLIRNPPRTAGQRGARIMGAAAPTPAPASSGDTDGVRASQLQHAVEHVDGHAHLSPRRSSVCDRSPSPIPRFHLPTAVSASAPVVA